LGYANLGALLMSLACLMILTAGAGCAAAITALMTGEAYKTSAEMAGMVGAFPRFNENKEGMLDVMKMHGNEIKKIDVEAMPVDLNI